MILSANRLVAMLPYGVASCILRNLGEILNNERVWIILDNNALLMHKQLSRFDNIIF